MYISILDFVQGKVFIVEINDTIDADEYVSEEFGLDNVSYMTMDKLRLEIYNE